MIKEDDEAQWLGVIGRSLAFLCLAQADLRDKNLATQATFLEGLGMKRQDVATLLGANPKTLYEVLSRARKPKRGKNAKNKKPRS